MEKLFKPIMFIVGAIFVLSIITEVSLKKIEHFKNVKMDVSSVTASERERQLECLSRNIYYEAGSEPFEGKVAVAQVTLNRVESGKFPADVCKVIFQKNVFMERVVCQFSWYCENAGKLKPVHGPNYTESVAAAKKVLLENFRLDGLKEAMFYHADYVNPRWNKEKVAKIGRHIFYK